MPNFLKRKLTNLRLLKPKLYFCIVVLLIKTEGSLERTFDQRRREDQYQRTQVIKYELKRVKCGKALEQEAY